MTREEGPRSLWFKLLGETVYRRLAIFELSLAAARFDVLAPDGVSLSLLGPEGLGDYLAFRPQASEEEVLARLRDGHLCFVARLDGRIVHASWTARGRMWSWYLDRHVPLAEDETCTYDTWTDPAVRGRGIAPALRAFQVRHLRDAGLRRLLATIYPENRPGTRLVEKLGYRRIGVIGWAGAGPLRRPICRVRGGARAPGEA